jgi:cation diffusion facilitator CzcD-associated flavoprotein CzcO
MTDLLDAEELDVLIVGAGLSGIGVGHYLTTRHPRKRFAILEARASLGGTWDLFRYPGIRSDSDLNTLGYDFKPWRGREAIAGAPKILDYLREAAAEDGLDARIRYRHRVLSVAWSSETARWTVDVAVTAADGTVEHRTILTRWIFGATGYYRYDQGYTPTFPGRDDFRGTIVHPQEWPEDLDYAGKRVVVIGSGATAVTLIPALLEGPSAAAHVTMLQRTPTYVMPAPRVDPVALRLRRWLGARLGYRVTRLKNARWGEWWWTFCREHPEQARAMIREANVQALPEGFDVDRHFNPPYAPWDQRLCAVPDGDLFQVISEGRASVVTDAIETFTPTGIRLVSGEELEADIIVTATGLNLQTFGGIDVTVDDRPVSLAEVVAYRGLMYSGVPNLAVAIGYTNASWTLKIGMLCEYWCRLLTYMDKHGYDAVRPEADPAMPTRPLLDFAAGYVQRVSDELPRQGDAAPWAMSKSYFDDRRMLRRAPMADPHLRFTTATHHQRQGADA